MLEWCQPDWGFKSLQGHRFVVCFLVALISVPWMGTGAARSQVDISAPDRVLRLPQPPGQHWVWAGDLVLRRSALFDADSGRMLGMIDGGHGVSGLVPLSAGRRGEICAVETIYAKGHRGPRTDLVTIYDATTLQVLGDVEVPPKRADAGHGTALSAVLDGGRFLLVFNQTPATSVSVVDLDKRRFVGEIDAPGCALVYPVGARRFAMLCGDGKAMAITLDDRGRESARAQSPRFFDATDDPVTEKGVRVGDSWLFATFDGELHEVDFAGPVPVPRGPWPLFTEAERSDGWRIGGTQHLAVHAGNRRLYSLVHKGGRGTHKDPGSEVWVYDLETHERVRRIPVANLLVAFLRGYLEDQGGRPHRGWLAGAVFALARWVVPNPGADSVVVTPDASPVMILGNSKLGALGVYDALSGQHLRDIGFTGVSGGRLVLP